MQCLAFKSSPIRKCPVLWEGIILCKSVYFGFRSYICSTDDDCWCRLQFHFMLEEVGWGMSSMRIFLCTARIVFLLLICSLWWRIHLFYKCYNLRVWKASASINQVSMMMAMSVLWSMRNLWSFIVLFFRLTAFHNVNFKEFSWNFQFFNY